MDHLKQEWVRQLLKPAILELVCTDAEMLSLGGMEISEIRDQGTHFGVGITFPAAQIATTVVVSEEDFYGARSQDALRELAAYRADLMVRSVKEYRST